MNILLVNPVIPETFWSFKHALKFVSKRASFPPLGLLTVAALLPPDWNKKLIDMNVQELPDEDILRADYIFLSGMSIQETSVRQVMARCKQLGRPIVAGGPLFTARAKEFEAIDHLVLNEAEITLPIFLRDLQNGGAKHLYTTRDWADVTTTPPPLWSLMNQRYYASMNVQYSRGCPYDCEFCDITVLYGRVPRTKGAAQFLAELDGLYETGWQGDVFLVDDNFIGNKRKLKKEILPALARWSAERKYPFAFSTEASVNLADDDELLLMMQRAGFDAVFVGIESTNEESLEECKKIPNKGRDLLAAVKKIHAHGMRVNGGFIFGFDSDPASVFGRTAAFIQESGIITAMVGLLNAPIGTRLYRRLFKEGRIRTTMSGDNTDWSMNFIPRMNTEALIAGYRSVLESIYAPKQYYERVKTFLKTFRPASLRPRRIRVQDLKAFAKSVVLLGVVGRERLQYWKLFFWTLFTRPRLFPMAITFSIYGFHFRKVFESRLVG